MTSNRKYFRDHFILLLASINVFISMFTLVLIGVKLITKHSSYYIVEYRPSLLDAYKPGSVLQIISFIVFSALITIIGLLLSYKVYKINRQLAIAVLCLTSLLLILSVLISNSLLLS
jgi:Na+-transporting NADH:ubiquinone oxidoreductase subunit NqrD